MQQPEIIRVWGKADSFDIEFSKENGNRWSCLVPPDTQDGVYAVEIWAKNESGFTGYLTALLYMCGGIHDRIEFLPSPYMFYFMPDSIACEFLSELYNITIERCDSL